MRVTTRGFENFRAAVARFAAEPLMRRVRGGQPVHDVAARAADPLRIAVRGRPGVGVSSVIAALGRTMPAEGIGHLLMEIPLDGRPASADAADVDVVVIAEALKPEDRQVLAESTVPRLLVLNKADLTDAGTHRGPWTAALARCAQYRAETGVPTLPLAAQAPLADIDDEMVAAIKTLVTDPADTRSVDGFVSGEHPVSVEMRQRLLRQLDLYPIGCAIGAMRQAPDLDAAGLTSLLRDISGIDALIAALSAAMLQARYRRAKAVVAALHHIGMTGELSSEIDRFLGSDECVLAVMDCAADAAAAAGLTVSGGEHPEDHRLRAVRWQRFSAGPVTPMYANIGTDICRGSLRLWKSAGGRL